MPEYIIRLQIKISGSGLEGDCGNERQVDSRLYGSGFEESVENGYQRRAGFEKTSTGNFKFGILSFGLAYSGEISYNRRCYTEY